MLTALLLVAMLAGDVQPGYLEINQMSAVNLDARQEDGLEPSGYRWKILEGEGGKLFGETKEDAVFLAPKVESGTRDFLIELTVLYKDQPSSVRQLRIRVLSLDPDAVPEQSATADDSDGPQWLKDHYRSVAEAEEQKQSNSPVVPGTSGKSGPQVSIGVAGGSYGTRGGVGLRWTMSHPVTQPVNVPPPGQTVRAGEGRWDRAVPVPRDKLDTTFPPDVAKRYR